jgi:hypothetical protein
MAGPPGHTQIALDLPRPRQPTRLSARLVGPDVHLPDLSAYDLDRIVEDSPVWGVAVPGLRVAYYRRGPREAAGVYTYQGVEIFVAWGYTDERQCRFHAFRDCAGDWEPPQPGCPRVRVQPGGGLLLRTRNGARELRPAQPVSAGTSTGRASRRTAASENPVRTSALTNVTAWTTGLTAGTKPITATGN